MLHHIQKSVLDNLAVSDSSRYSELKPNDMDGNIFSYHLKLLVSDRYLTKKDDGSYTLSRKGKDYIVHRYEDALSQAHSIFLIAIRRGDEWLMRERLVQPLLGMTGFVHGEPVADEPLIETASKRLQAKTGLSVPLSIHSSGLIRIFRGETLESFSHAIILTGQTDQNYSVAGDSTGRNYWLQASELEKADILPSCADIVTRISQDNTHSFEFTYRI